MIVVTGAAGFIASNLALALNKAGFNNLILVDEFETPNKISNYSTIRHAKKIDRNLFLEWFTDNAEEVEFVFHLGARTDTTEFNFRVLDSLNLSYSKAIWEICTMKQIPLLYASSAATYGLGENGFNDDESLISSLKPLNAYGVSKQLFDVYVLEQKEHPPFWAGLKFFNVYGFGEAHKGRMASVVYHAFQQIKETGKLKLFQSHNPDFKDGEQLRDFIFVDDIIRICFFFFKHQKHNGIYNAGTGKARSFNDLGKVVFTAMNLPANIEYKPTPEDIRDKYQYFTEAKMEKLRNIGFENSFTSLEEGVEQYISESMKQA